MRFSLCLLFYLLSTQLLFSQRETLPDLLLQLDNAIKTCKKNSDVRESRIADLKQKLLSQHNTPAEVYNLNMQLYGEYKPYKCDSAIAYLNKNIDIANLSDNQPWLYESNLLLSRLLGASGMYKEAADILVTIHREKLPLHLLPYYYTAYETVYGELSVYTQDKRIADQYRLIAHTYRDSLFSVLPVESEMSLIMQENKLRDSGKIDAAIAINEKRIATNKFGTSEHALATFHRSLCYFDKENAELKKYYLCLSALSDIHAAIKDHASLWMLAQIFFEEGNIDRAYNYMRFSWSETVFYNARLRSLQSAGILSLIDKTYQIKIEKQNEKLQQSLLLISILVFSLIIALYYIYRQIKRLSTAKNHLMRANDQLQQLNEELLYVNKKLSTNNLALSESNRIKEEYIGRFIKLCSTYIDKLDTYRRMVNKSITGGRINELLQITRSQDALNHEVELLFHNFDTAFLQLFPDFVSQFNRLLLDKEAILPKKEELLNTELRIFALIRLGIIDSSQIAEFLRYSVNTIYNYRAKVKNKACVSRDDFESLVMKIR